MANRAQRRGKTILSFLEPIGVSGVKINKPKSEGRGAGLSEGGDSSESDRLGIAIGNLEQGENNMHRKQHLAAATVIQRPPSITIVLEPATIEGLDQFIRNVGCGKGIKTRSEAIEFLLDDALLRMRKLAEPNRR